MKSRHRLLIVATAVLALAPVSAKPAEAPAALGQQPTKTDQARPLHEALPVTVTPNEPAKRVDVSIGGQPFTSYIWPERLT